MDTRAEHQPAESLRDQLRTAEVNLKAAMTHFRALRKAAFAGRYDPDEFDEAVLSCRAAEASLLAAQHAVAGSMAESPGGQPPDVAPVAPAPVAPAPVAPAAPPTPDPLARLRFARWLVETGRLSEQLAA
jgi:hypothetical protein